VSCQELSPAFSQLGYGIISFLQGLFFELFAQLGAMLAAVRPPRPVWPRCLTPELSSAVRCRAAEEAWRMARMLFSGPTRAAGRCGAQLSASSK